MKRNYPLEKAKRVIQSKKIKLALMVHGDEVLYDVFQKENGGLIRLGICKVIVDERKKPEQQVIAEEYISATGKDLKKRLQYVTNLLRKELPIPNET